MIHPNDENEESVERERESLRRIVILPQATRLSRGINFDRCPPDK